MNRQMKRMLRRQGAAGADGATTVDTRRQAVARRPAPARRERTSPAAFLREVRAELRRVAWPTRAEVANYSAIVLFTLVVVVALIFAFDYVFAKSVLFLFEAPQ